MLNCLDLDTGAVIWRCNILDDASATTPEWGVAGSPLIVGEHVIVNPGGPSDRSVVAYDAADGKFVWGGGSERANWSSPVLARIAANGGNVPADFDHVIVGPAHEPASP